MSGIYGDRPLTERETADLGAVGGGIGLADFYNQADPRSTDRASSLKVIWGKGGIPVIGSGPARAPVQDFGGVDNGPRGIDTGIRAGSPDAVEHQASMDQRPGGTGIYGGGPLAPYARLNPTRTSESGAGGIGMFTADRKTRQPSKEERALASALALENAKGAGLAAAMQSKAGQEQQKAEIAAGAERYKADRQATMEEAKMIAEAKKQAAEAMRGITRGADNIFYGPDGKPLSDDDQRAWSGRALALESLNVPQVIGRVKQWKNDPANWVPMVDRTTGKIDVLPRTTKGIKGDWGEPEWMHEKVGEAHRWITPFEFDPVVAGQLYSHFQL